MDHYREALDFLTDWEEHMREDNNDFTHSMEVYMVRRSTVSSHLRYHTFVKCGFRCVYCGVKAQDNERVRLEIDHIIPISLGGDNKYTNLQVLCHECNVGKGAR